MAKKPRPEDLLDWIGLTDAPDWKLARPYGRLIGFVVSAVLIFVPILVIFALIAAFVVVIGTSHQVWTGAGGPNLGAGALIAAILGAPFVIWGTVIKHRQLGFQKEGHITDRISKAVEQLGAEKVVERIGRSVTIFTGKPERISYPEEAAAKLADRPRTRLSKCEWEEHWDERLEDVDRGYRQTVSTWPAERTVIQWQGDVLNLEKHEEVGSEGAWTVFKETEPNIEVRIGGLLSLERISQDSVNYDHGRDHVRVMEILCAYIRNNAKAGGARDFPFPDWEPLKDDATSDERNQRQAERKKRFGYLTDSYARHWTETLPKVREDIQLALSILGRRGMKQRLHEARWGDRKCSVGEWPFDSTSPSLSKVERDELTPITLRQYLTSLKTWKKQLDSYAGFRLDLRETNLQNADLSDGNFSGALLTDARMEGANLARVRLEGANLKRVRMEGADAQEARMQGARLSQARMEGVNLRQAHLEASSLARARLEGVHLRRAHLEGTNLSQARMQGANLRQAYFDGARLKGARMEGGYLRQVYMSNTMLTHAFLADVYIRDAHLDAISFLHVTTLAGIALRDIDCRNLKFTRTQIEGAFGDASVILSNDPPGHWPRWTLPNSGEYSFHAQWRKWQENPEAYVPPPPPDPAPDAN